MSHELLPAREHTAGEYWKAREVAEAQGRTVSEVQDAQDAAEQLSQVHPEGHHAVTTAESALAKAQAALDAEREKQASLVREWNMMLHNRDRLRVVIDTVAEKVSGMADFVKNGPVALEELIVNGTRPYDIMSRQQERITAQDLIFSERMLPVYKGVLAKKRAELKTADDEIDAFAIEHQIGTVKP